MSSNGHVGGLPSIISTEKSVKILEMPEQTPVIKKDIRWLTYIGRGLGGVAIILGVLTTTLASVTLNGEGIGSGIWQTVAGVLIIMIESSSFSPDVAQDIGEFEEKHSFWNRGILYALISFPAVFVYPTLTILFGSGLIYLTGIIYLLITLRKRKTRDN